MPEGHQGDRTEPATPKRRQDAKKKGQVPRSPEVQAAFLLLASAGLLHTGGGALALQLRELFTASVLKGRAPAVGVPGTAGFLQGVGWSVLAALMPFLLTLAGVALLVGAVQARGVLSLEPMKPKGEKLDPVKNIPRIWGWKAPMELGKSILKFVIVVGAMYLVLSESVSELPSLTQRSPMALLLTIREFGVRVLAGAGAAFLLLALADYAYQVWQNERQMKMSKQEIKEEQKDTDGDPNVKARRRSLARSLARRRMLLDVSEADVVVTNPTHVAVALKYDPEVADAPVVLAKGERKMAERIKELAAEAGVPMVENRPLARTLLATTEVGRPIPVELYLAVAEVLAFVLRQRRGRSAGEAAS